MPSSDVSLVWPMAITDGKVSPISGLSTVGDFAYTVSGLRYVQIDLGAIYAVDKVRVYHFYNNGRAYYGTRTQVSADGIFWVTVFDSAILGEYPETPSGRTTTFAQQGVRYVRDYLNGSTSNTGNHWVEIEVWGNPIP